MRIKTTIAILLYFTSGGVAQTAATATFDRTVKTLGNLSLGTSMADFIRQKPTLLTLDTTMGFRAEIIEKVEKDGLESVTYYFDMDGEKPLYELILQFSTEENRRSVIEKLFGPANHPEKQDYWILGADGGVLSMGWAFDQSFAIAINFPGTEWDSDERFKLPKGFEPYKNLPIPTDWPKAEIARFFHDLQLQIEAGIKGFETIKGAPLDGQYQCTQPIGMAQVSIIMEDGAQNWLVSNEMTADMTPENAADWKASMRQILVENQPDSYRLAKAESKKLFGVMADVWNVLDKQQNFTGIQVAVVAFGDPLQGVSVVVMRK